MIPRLRTDVTVEVSTRPVEGLHQVPANPAGRSARPGDLVFFYSGSSIYHVGVYAGNG